MASKNTVNALAKLDGLIRHPQSRQQFHKHPYATLQNTGAEPGDVPSDVWQALTEMTLEELGAIANLGGALTKAGLLDGELRWKFVV